MSKSFIRSSSIVSAMTFVSRILGLIRDFVIARLFGANELTDAFLVAFRIPNFFRRLFAEGAFSQAFLPILADAKANYISDDNPSANPDRGESTSVANSSSNESLHAAGELGAGGYQDIGNRLASFSILVTNNLGYTGSEDNCYDCQAPTIESVEVSYDGEALIASTSTPVNVSAEVGDTVTFTIAVSDNTSTATIPYAGIFTNFGDRPGDMNLFYTNNFDDSLSAISSSFYEWNASGDDTAYDHSGVV